MSGEDEAATYAEVNDVSSEAFAMDVNKYYSNTSSKSKSDVEENSSNGVRYFIFGLVLFVIILVLAATSACVIFALVEIAKLKSETRAGLSTLKQNQQQLSMFQQNVSAADASIVVSVSRNSAELSELRQNLSQQLMRPELTISCSALSPSSPSGYYWVVASNGSVVHVYCDMTLSYGGVTGGWTRVAELNMTDTSQQCPSNFVERNSNNIRRCETMNAAQNIDYRKVCGRITGYQVGTTNAFREYYHYSNIITINSTYVDGISLTHGNPRQHIWTFAACFGQK